MKNTSIKTLKSACMVLLLLSIKQPLDSSIRKGGSLGCACPNLVGTSFIQFNPAPDTLNVVMGPVIFSSVDAQLSALALSALTVSALAVGLLALITWYLT